MPHHQPEASQSNNINTLQGPPLNKLGLNATSLGLNATSQAVTLTAHHSPTMMSSTAPPAQNSMKICRERRRSERRRSERRRSVQVVMIINARSHFKAFSVIFTNHIWNTYACTTLPLYTQHYIPNINYTGWLGESMVRYYQDRVLLFCLER